jgi:hypothetical protein
MRAEAAARQLGHLPLDQALKLLFLYIEKEPIKFERAALRWLVRYVTEGKAVSLLKAQLASLLWPSFEPESERPRPNAHGLAGSDAPSLPSREGRLAMTTEV